jgi:hypothetical protein
VTPEQIQQLGAVGVLSFVVLAGGRLGLQLLTRVADRLILALDKLEAMLHTIEVALKDREVEAERRHAVQLEAIKDAAKETRHAQANAVMTAQAQIILELHELRAELAAARAEIAKLRT